MNVFDHFSVPYSSLKDGFHQYEFVVDNLFFEAFDHSPIKEGNFTVQLGLDKKASLSHLTFDIRGNFKTNCDRCLADIDMPIRTEELLVIKEDDRNETDDEIMYVKSDQPFINLAQVIYEYIVIASPMINIYDCEGEIPRKCDMEVLKNISDENIIEEQKSGEVGRSIVLPPDLLKNLDLDN